MAPANRTLQDGMSVGGRPAEIVWMMSSRLLMRGWPYFSPPQTVVRFGTVTTFPLYTFCPPVSPGPWQRWQLNPIWFSSDPGSVVSRPRSTDWDSCSSVSFLLFTGSWSQTTGTRMAMATTNTSP